MKAYTFTMDEQLALRDALVEEYQRCKHLTSPGALKRLQILRTLADQFKDDLIKSR